MILNDNMKEVDLDIIVTELLELLKDKQSIMESLNNENVAECSVTTKNYKAILRIENNKEG